MSTVFYTASEVTEGKGRAPMRKPEAKKLRRLVEFLTVSTAREMKTGDKGQIKKKEFHINPRSTEK